MGGDWDQVHGHAVFYVQTYMQTHTHAHAHTQYSVMMSSMVYLSLWSTQNAGQAMIPVHHIATSIIQHASVARKHKLFSVAMDSLSKIHTIPSVPVVDCFQKIRQQVSYKPLGAGVSPL